MSPVTSRPSSLKEKAVVRKSSKASSLGGSTVVSVDITRPPLKNVDVKTPEVKRSSISKSTSRHGSIAFEKSAKPAHEKVPETKQASAGKTPAVNEQKDPFNEPIPDLDKRQHERAVDCLSRLAEKFPIPQTKYTKQRSIYYSKMSTWKLTGKLTRYMHMNNVKAGGLFLKAAWTWVNPSIDIGIAYREYLRRGCDPEYFTSGAGAGCVVS